MALGWLDKGNGRDKGIFASVETLAHIHSSLSPLSNCTDTQNTVSSSEHTALITTALVYSTKLGILAELELGKTDTRS